MAAHHLLGKQNDGNLILLAGPDYTRILNLVEASGLRHRGPAGLSEVEEVAELKKHIADTGQSIVITASIPEVEGRLDRSSFERNLISLAFAADRVIYAGMRAAVLIWPDVPNSRRDLTNGHMRVTQNLDIVEPGQTVIGLKADRL